MHIADVNSLVEVRPGRRLWLKSRSTSPASEIVVLFIHGVCANLQQWNEQEAAVFERGFSTVRYDAYGCGQSDKPRSFEAYSPEQLYRDAEAVLNSIVEDGKKVVIVGHSFGSAIALPLASSHSTEVMGLVLISAFAPAKEPVKPSLFSLAAWLFYFPEWVLAWMQPSLTEGFLKAAFHKQTWKSQPELIEQERKHSDANPPHMFKALHRQMAGWTTYEEYCGWAAATRQPARVVYGDADPITPLLPSSKVLMQNLARAKLTVVEGASHQVMQEKPQAVNTVIVDLLRKVKPGG